MATTEEKAIDLYSGLPQLSTLTADDKVLVRNDAGQNIGWLPYSALCKTVIGSLQIGGRNYLPDSEKEIGKNVEDNSPEYISVAPSQTDLVSVYDAIGVGPAVLSFEAKSVGVEGNCIVYSCPGDTQNFKYIWKQATIQLSSEWQRYALPIDIVLNNPDAQMVSISFFGKYGTGIVPHVRKIKLEKGYVATDWSPAPEDLGYGQ